MPASGFFTSCATTAGHLPDAGERGLIAQPILAEFPLGDVVADRRVPIRLAGLIQERDDRGIDPVEVAVLRAIPDLAAPDPAGRDRPPHVLEEVRWMQPGIDDPVILSDQLVT